MEDIPLLQLSDQIFLEILPEPVYLDSLRVDNNALFFMGGQAEHKALYVAARRHALVSRFEGAVRKIKEGRSAIYLNTCPLNSKNAQLLRSTFTNLKPVPFGIQASAGFGDRLGLATPGHAMAVRGTGIAPIFAQQSIREMDRTHRTPIEVLDDATWGAFQAGWTGPVGADADHLKTIEQADLCIAAGYSFYTVDPGAKLDQAAGHAPLKYIDQKKQAIPWPELETDPASFEKVYLNQAALLPGMHLGLDPEKIWRFMAIYAEALVLVKQMYRHLASRLGVGQFDFEISVDETETPTSPLHHYLIALELRRLGVHWTSLAPRFSGRFEKGVDFIGDLQQLAVELQQHAEIARTLGPYKISLHSGSDKFSIYPAAADALGNLFHLKTAGTSYLEALDVIAQTNPDLFRQILKFSIERYHTDRASYHVSAETNRLPEVDAIKDKQLPELLDNFDARQVLHVTFGSVLSREDGSSGSTLGSLLKSELLKAESQYDQQLKHHFTRHLEPFIGALRNDNRQYSKLV